MHELSIAMGIVEAAEEEAMRLGVTEVFAVHFKLGTLTGVVKEALLSSYELAVEDTVLKKAKLIIDVVQGRELELFALEIEQ
jgi:hydrogenase nickel incorporation protein HypA/HybF